ncbi:MAG TPA: hypothetical protein VK324_03285 [Tepidisphaeraceae bacterium]|nr:hypothetical protein [Tepidisphaeraceae bacterium]
MATGKTFDEALDVVEHLPPDEQAELVAVVQRRLAQRRRQQLIDDVRKARDEFGAGQATPATVDDLMGRTSRDAPAPSGTHVRP